MLDKDLADLYEVPTKLLNLAVKRDIKRFPDDFMFQLTKEEFDGLRSQIVKLSQSSSSQIVMMGTMPQNRTGKYLPYAFTEQGVAMLSGILNSDKAINMPARLTPVGREYRYHAGLCRNKKNRFTARRYKRTTESNSASHYRT